MSKKTTRQSNKSTSTPYRVYATWHGYAVIRHANGLPEQHVGTYDCPALADAICDDLNRLTPWSH
jgi:hypothetical protein